MLYFSDHFMIMNTTVYTTTDVFEVACTNSSKPDLGLYLLESGFVLEILIIVCSVYLTVAFIIHGNRHKMLISKSKKDMHRGLVFKFALITVIIPFFRYASTLSFMLSGRLCGEAACETSADVGYIALMCSITTTYSFLWIRQRVFYGHPSLCDRYGRCLVYFSKFVLIPIVMEGVVAVAVAVIPLEYTARKWQCYPITHQTDFKVLLYAALMVVTQSLLLGLFLHPVVSHMKVQRRMRQANGGSINEPSTTCSHDSSFSDSYSKSTMTHRPSADYSLSPISDTAPNEDSEITQQTTNSEKIETEVLPVISENTDESADVEPSSRYERKPRSKSAPDLLRTAVSNSQHLVLARSTTYIQKSGLNGAKSRRKKSGMMSTLRSKGSAIKDKVRKTRSTVRSRGKVMKLIKRTVYLCLICISSDFLVSVINFLGWDAIHQAMQFVIYDVSLMVNVITVIASFENFKKILVLPYRCCFEDKASWSIWASDHSDARSKIQSRELTIASQNTKSLYRITEVTAEVNDDLLKDDGVLECISWHDTPETIVGFNSHFTNNDFPCIMIYPFSKSTVGDLPIGHIPNRDLACRKTRNWSTVHFRISLFGWTILWTIYAHCAFQLWNLYAINHSPYSSGNRYTN